MLIDFVYFEKYSVMNFWIPTVNIFATENVGAETPHWFCAQKFGHITFWKHIVCELRSHGLGGKGVGLVYLW